MSYFLQETTSYSLYLFTTFLLTETCFFLSIYFEFVNNWQNLALREYLKRFFDHIFKKITKLPNVKHVNGQNIYDSFSFIFRLFINQASQRKNNGELQVLETLLAGMSSNQQKILCEQTLFITYFYFLSLLFLSKHSWTLTLFADPAKHFDFVQ